MWQGNKTSQDVHEIAELLTVWSGLEKEEIR
jgi:hypothetical protein